MDDFSRFHPLVEWMRARRLRNVRGRDFTMTHGEYDDAGGRMARARARCLFWSAFDQEVDGALDELFSSPEATELELDSQLKAPVHWPTERAQLHIHTWGVRYRLWPDETPMEDPPGHRELCLDLLAAVRERSEQPGSKVGPVDTLCQMAARTALWAPIKYGPRPLAAVDPRIAVYVDFSEPLDIRLSSDDGMAMFAWNPLIETAEAAKHRLMAEFEDQLSTAMVRRSQEAEARGLVRVDPEIGKKRTTEHFRWLVRYQCLVHSYDLIARTIGKDRKTVMAGVASTAELVQIDLRPRRWRGGRRRKNRAASTTWKNSLGG